MSQNEFQDIIPPNTKSIRNINNSHTMHSEQPAPQPEAQPQQPQPLPQQPPMQPPTPPVQPSPQPEYNNPEEPMDIPTPPSDRNPKSSKLGLMSVGGIILVLLVLSFTLFLADSKVTVMPKQKVGPPFAR